MAKKRLLLIAGLLASIACMVLVALALLPPRAGVTKEKFDRIEIGMTVVEVETILGGTGQPFHGFANKKHLETFVWPDDDGSLAFIDVSENLVTDKKWQPSPEKILDKLRRWLHIPK
jgi:hypothetical protein